MKSFSKLFSGLAAAGLLLAGCASATVNQEGNQPVEPVVLFDFEGSLDSTNWTAAAGYQNGATIAALALDTTYTGSQSSGGRNYDFNGAGTKTWPDVTDVGDQTLKAVLKTDASTGDALGNSHVVLSFFNVDFGEMAKYTGVEFYLKVPQGETDPLKKIGLSPILRYNDGEDENAAVYTAPLNDPEAEDFSDPTDTSEVYDWVYFGDDAWLHFKVPFSCFSVPGWASVDNATIALALANGVVFNEFNLDFRFAVSDSEGGVAGTDYPVYLDNVGLY